MIESSEFKAQGKRLSKLRKAKGLTAEQLAEQMTHAGSKVSRGAISNWERGINGIVSAKLPTLAKILECSEGYLLRGDIEGDDIDGNTEYKQTHNPNTKAIHPNETDNLKPKTQNQPSVSSDAQIETAKEIAIDDTYTNEPYKNNFDTRKTAMPNTNQSNQANPQQLNHQQTSSQQSSPQQALMKSDKLKNVCYDIRGPLLRTAMDMEAQGQRVIKLNVGNPAPFGLNAPHEILQDVALNLHKATGYSDSQGIFSARKAILQYYQAKGLLSAMDVRDVYLGNGVSELIVMTMQAMVNDGDEVLIPMPDYPLWTAATNLAGGNAVHYRCNEKDGWQPDIDDIRAKITHKTRGIVVINPNNPTGALYSDEILQQIIALAREFNLVIMADEIYDRVLYDDAVHTPMCTLASDVLILTYNGLSKSHRIAGFRAGWMMLSGRKDHAEDFIAGLDMLASMRLCANVPAQHAIQTALGGYQSMKELTSESGRLYKQRQMAVERLNAIPGVSCTMPQGAFYLFPKIDLDVYPIEDDTQFMMDLLLQQKVLIVQGSGFNWDAPDHFRVVFLPNLYDLEEAMDRLDKFFADKRVEYGTEHLVS